MNKIIERHNYRAGLQPDFKILDGLRGIAALYVMFNHARGNLFIGGVKYAAIKPLAAWSLQEKVYFSALQLTSLGREFVVLFFILSGFSIAYSLNKMPNLKEFYLKRAIRIYPPYLLALLWAFVVFRVLQFYTPALLPLGSAPVFDTVESTIKNIFYINSGYLIPQFWSLTMEVIFYLLVPFFLFKRNIYFGTSIILLLISLCVSWKDVTESNSITLYFLEYNFFFACGIFCFHYYDKVSAIFIIKNKWRFFTVAFFLFLIMVTFKFWVKYEMNKVSTLMAALFSIVMLFNFLHHNIKNKMLIFLGSISYTVYITHFASVILLVGIFLKLKIVGSPQITNKFLWITGIPFALLISYLLYLVAEKPSRQLLKTIRSRGN